MATYRDQPNQEADLLFTTRFHGAVNIRGIRYQILYSVLRAFELYQHANQTGWIRLEGIEDVELLGVRLENEYVQVKTSDKPWTWARLRDPLKGLLAVHRADPNARLTIAVNFPLKDDLGALASLHAQSPNEVKRIEERLQELCENVGASQDEAVRISSRLTVLSLPEDMLWQRLRLAVADAYNLGSESVEIYILALVARFLDWAKDRKTLDRSDLDRISVDIGEALSRENEFQAYGRGLVDRISWEIDAAPADFLNGKGTRTGHIAAGLDVRRPDWIALIDRAVKAARLCVLRAPSGQGKSSLLYRYAHDYWPADNVLMLNVAETPDHVQVICSYLRLRAQLGQPNLLLVDNAGWKTRLWSDVAAEAIRLGFRVLVGVREEDWIRFAHESVTTYEVLEPRLSLTEARQIFRAIRLAGRLHPSVDSAERAYEQIGTPQLLMEYVYLLTQGRMLEERLRDQEKQFAEQGEDPSKPEIIRRVALAHVLGASVDADHLIAQIHLKEDRGRILRSLSSEYIQMTQGKISGLHWVRSEHLTRILHEGFPSQTSTAIAVLGSVPVAELTGYVSNALLRAEIDSDTFLRGLLDWTKGQELSTILQVTDGLFDAGERTFFQVNRQLFDEVYDRGGQSLVFLVSSDSLPIGNVDVLSPVIELLGNRGQRLEEFRARLAASGGVPRGIESVAEFLQSILPCIPRDQFQRSPGNVGRLLDWCALAHIPVPDWHEIRAGLIAGGNILGNDIEDLLLFAQGLYRYDEAAYHEWRSSRMEALVDHLRLMLDCIEIKISPEAVESAFVVRQDAVTPNDQAVSRLRSLRSVFPFAEHYRSRGIWLLPPGLSASVDDTRKNMPRHNLQFQTDVDKNVVWKVAVESNYSFSSYYDYQKAWSEVRRLGLVLVRRISSGLRRFRAPGQPFDIITGPERMESFGEFESAIKLLPDPPVQAPESLARKLRESSRRWSNSFHSFLLQGVEFSMDNTQTSKASLSLHNFRDAEKHLSPLQTAFAEVFEVAPDYFNLSALSKEERKEYSILGELLEAWIVDPPKESQRDMIQYARARRTAKLFDVLRRLEEALEPLRTRGMMFVLPSGVEYDHPLSYLPLGFSVSDLCDPIADLEVTLDGLLPVAEIADFFWLVPMFGGARIAENGYLIGSRGMDDLLTGRSGRWESLVPQKVSGIVLSLLGNPPVVHFEQAELRSEIDALLVLIEICVEGEKLLITSRSTGSETENRLLGRYRSEFSAYRESLSQFAKNVETQIRTRYDSGSNQRERRTVVDFLADLRGGFEEEPIGELNLPAVDVRDRALLAADKLLCGAATMPGQRFPGSEMEIDQNVTDIQPTDQ